MDVVDAKILVVDDDAEIRHVLRTVLEHAGHSVISAADGEEAMSQMLEHHPPLVLLDLMMPRMDGLDVIRMMHEEPSLKNVSVIAFTALSSQLIEKELFDLGVQGFMRKPLRIKDLQQMVAAELKRISLGQSETLDS